eukprot:CAMPEP_0176395438 /NCGR_PEP_ID=MMETSP0126-20121128/43409_1 /TAXON_ID=141414 ORGANISM="Strombidinopsis acuminatum, Strain SPMC142" /NCGR_SAMPLE_ID=MMETSP0126 /ASSEMBLY_ACC=CAM_ASM_000229 /LENGTH=58 /DNA_ID=CAMNT_0017768317 /DNA_START=81 /DNA_END=257 /DNA_ORIENTATION=-
MGLDNQHYSVDGGMEFDADDLANSKPSGIKHDVHIGFDRNSNKIVGWDDLFSKLDEND